MASFTIIVLVFTSMLAVCLADRWRSDGRCGPDSALSSGLAAECDPYSLYPCCSLDGWCGNTLSHCECNGCVDFRMKLANGSNVIEKGANGWPSFSKLWGNYPQDASRALIKKCKLPDWLIGQNSCAIRVSYSLITSGRKLNDIQKGECNWAQVVNGDGDKYIIRVATMRCYLESRKGSADIVSSSKTSFQGYKGIIVFQSCKFQTATGHVDLWDGSKCAGTCYFDSCKDMRLFIF